MQLRKDFTESDSIVVPWVLDPQNDDLDLEVHGCGCGCEDGGCGTCESCTSCESCGCDDAADDDDSALNDAIAETIAENTANTPTDEDYADVEEFGRIVSPNAANVCAGDVLTGAVAGLPGGAKGVVIGGTLGYLTSEACADARHEDPTES